ncbi:MAG TPA: hypothetical protein VN903_26670 [Polyangia bacterium]|nr:hypothetical protein [Polyangia bacterium]
MSVSAIVELGRSIESAWSAREFDLRAFPGLCVERLQAARLHEAVEPDDVIRWGLTTADLPAQLDPKSTFGQPPLTVFRGRRFVIDVLFWVDATTAIHDHGFSGAFSVLAGSSIETTFAFAVSQDFDGRFRLGELGVQGTTLRRAGDVAAISAGPGFIHSLFHLQRPSVSVVVRTFADPATGLQFRYHRSGFAHQERFEDEVRDRQVQLVDLMLQTEHPSFEVRAGDLIAQGDLHTAFAVVRACHRVRDPRVQERLVERFRDRRIAAMFHDWLLQERRLTMLRRARADVTDAQLRFVLAVLMNAHRRADALSLVAAFVPSEDPARWVARSLKQLSTLTLRLQVRNLPLEPNILGLPAFEEGFEEALATALAGGARGRNEPERQFIARLAELPVLAPLFR